MHSTLCAQGGLEATVNQFCGDVELQTKALQSIAWGHHRYPCIRLNRTFGQHWKATLMDKLLQSPALDFGFRVLVIGIAIM